MKNTIEEINKRVNNTNRKISTSPFMYSLEKNNTEVTMIINVLKKTIDKKSTMKLSSNIFK